MFDIGFSELIVIGVVALVVIGPERLPKVARTAGLLLGRLQRYVNDVKADISREIELDELKKIRTDVQESAREFERSISNSMQALENQVADVADTTRRELSASAEAMMSELPALSDDLSATQPKATVEAVEAAPLVPAPAAVEAAPTVTATAAAPAPDAAAAVSPSVPPAPVGHDAEDKAVRP